MGKLELQRLEGITSFWSPVVGVVSVPAQPEVRLRARSKDGVELQWIGVDSVSEVDDYCVARVELHESEERLVTVALEGMEAEPLRIVSTDQFESYSALGEISVEPVGFAGIYKPGMGSFDSLVALGPNHYRTSSDRLLRFSTQGLVPGFKGPIEWRIDGNLFYGSSIEYRFTRPGMNKIYVGPPTNPRVVTVETYRAVITVPPDANSAIEASNGRS